MVAGILCIEGGGVKREDTKIRRISKSPKLRTEKLEM